jgi:hypothetical protein
VPGSSDRPVAVPSEELPEQLVPPLWEWVQSCLVNDRRLLRELDTELRLDLGGTTSAAGFATGMLALRARALEDRGFLLDVVGTVLDLRHASGQTWVEPATRRLRGLLATVDSTYAVADDGSALDRPDAAASSRPGEAGGYPQGPAGECLTRAWVAAYSAAAPDPVRSYAESVAAVETALRSLGGESLDALIDVVAADPSAWRLVLGEGVEGVGVIGAPGVPTVLAMLRLLRNGHTSRPVGVGAPRPETLPEARAAVHLAGTLVQWVTAAAFTRAGAGPSG